MPYILYAETRILLLFSPAFAILYPKCEFYFDKYLPGKMGETGMMEKEPLLVKEMAAVLDNAPVAVIVRALEDFTLLYANSPAKSMLSCDFEGESITCYRAFGNETPCSFCPARQLSRTELFTRKMFIPESGHTFQLSGKIIDWAGRPAHIEYIRDISEQARLDKELAETNEKMQDIVNAIPGGVAIYRVSDIFETVYFSDGVPELSGYTTEEYRELIKRDAAELTYPEDTALVVEKALEAIKNHTVADFEFRKLHRDGHIVWVHVQARQIGEEGGCPLLHCIFHDISALKKAQQERDHLINSIPGGIASFQWDGLRFTQGYYSDGVALLSGRTRKEYNALVRHDVLDAIYEPDRERVLTAALGALKSGEVLDVSFRMRHKNGNLIWVHLNGRRMGPYSESMCFYGVFTGLSAENQLFQSIANETADGIYVIDRETYDLLYVNESKDLFAPSPDCLGQKCYAALRGKAAPCEFCTLQSHAPDGEEHAMTVNENGRFYTTRFTETDWNGIPAYIKFVRDITEEVNTRREMERLEVYFQSVVKNLPGGISVIRCEPDGSMEPEFISDGLAAMTHMTVEQVNKLYRNDIFKGIHPDDIAETKQKLLAYMEKGEGHCELTARMQCGDGGYVWATNTLSLLRTTDGIRRLYCVYTDISQSVKEKEQLRRQYEDILLKHYRKPGPNELILGHCNITQNKILDIIDYTGSDLLKTFGTVREDFFAGIASLVADKKERRAFLDTYLNAPALAAFKRNETEQILNCFIKLPREKNGRYVRFKVNLVETPDTGDITGVLTVTDITEQTISDRILHQLSVTSYDYVIDLNLEKDFYTVLTCKKNIKCPPQPYGRHSERVAYMVQSVIAPKDREQYARALEPGEIRRRLDEEGSYTFSYSVFADKKDIRTKNMTVSAIDLRLGRICLVCTDITDSVREEQGLLNMMAYTFELMGILHIGSGRFTMYTRQTVLENLSPYIMEDYAHAMQKFTALYGADEDKEEIREQFQMETMIKRLSEKPSGYDFVFPFQSENGVRYKQVNVLWGDENHSTVCMVRADVTDMLAAERKSKQALEKALSLAEEANRAKSDFLSAMSHDIRTPMNAIMGMTTLACAHLDDRKRVEDCLRKISISSKHLLSLINDVLDMSKIERSQITLNRASIYLPELIEQLCAIMAPQARTNGIQFKVKANGIRHEYIYGDSLRISQILINLLSNAVKFTPEGGTVEFTAEEIPPEKDKKSVRIRFTVRDTGIGMPEEFLAHVFSPFARGRAASRIEGTGLGLSITKGLVDLMGGEISVESREKKGSVFRVELECEEAPAEKTTAKLEAGAAEALAAMDGTIFSGRTFLVAEDNPINAEILCELLSMFGAQSVLKTDGSQAVLEFQEKPQGFYDAVLMDIQMPVMNGYDATRAIRNTGRADAKSIPVIAMTANAFAEDIEASYSAGMTAHVAKPVDLDILKSTLCRVLGK